MRFMLVLLFGVLSHSLACAQSPEWVKELTLGTAGTHRKVPPCKLTFDIGWSHVMTAGQATLTVREAGEYWRADASAASTGLARSLWKYDCEMTSIMHRGDLRAHYLQHRETDSAETCRYRVSFERHRVITETQVQPVKGSPSKSTTLCAYGPMDDILSVILTTSITFGSFNKKDLGKNFFIKETGTCIIMRFFSLLRRKHGLPPQIPLPPA